VQFPPGKVAPAGSSRSSGGGDKSAEAFDVKGLPLGSSASRQARTRVNAEWASKRQLRKPTRRQTGECRRRGAQVSRPRRGKRERKVPRFRRGVGRWHVCTRKSTVTREVPTVAARDRQPGLREEQTGPWGMTERPVVAMKPGNAGGAKGPWFQFERRKWRKPRRLANGPTNPTEG
jgi:hypothetical protein